MILDLKKGLYLRSELSEQDVGNLVANGYGLYETRISTKHPKIEYLVKVRPNESEEHAFLCWWTESLLVKRGIRPKLVAARGPDLEIKWKGKLICFEVETGKRFRYMKRTEMAARFSERGRQYAEVYLIVPSERIGRTYRDFCSNIITKAELEHFIDSFISSHTTL